MYLSLLSQLMGYDVGSGPVWSPLMAVGTAAGNIYIIHHEKLTVCAAAGTSRWWESWSNPVHILGPSFTRSIAAQPSP